MRYREAASPDLIIFEMPPDSGLTSFLVFDTWLFDEMFLPESF